MLHNTTYLRVINRVHQLKRWREETTDILQKVELTNRIHTLQKTLMVRQKEQASSS